ncbi:MAG TPA: hypothetical protein VE631_11140 [Alphaproteobacteria bacterium]|jgi:FtsH-binding integral membrane protein|nr:hypothetical protein [Alphaproteobacteria bacterium]
MRANNNSVSGPGGVWLAAGTLLLAAALVFHGPPDADLSVQMQKIADGHGRWAAVHWTAATALFLISGASFLNLVLNPRVRHSPILSSAWMVMALGALTTFSTAVTEASVVAVAADRGDTDAFMTWWAFSGGMGNGFWALALATALVAYHDARSDEGILPRWAAIAGTAFGVLSATGWTLGEQLGIGIGGPIWLISSLLMCLWLAGYGLSSRGARSGQAAAQGA